ncbi:unnamed protein product [Polarella glacialis]|uniref:Uncharacterized protein n=1 Tax=Polarella glacialis TaxID=89957 RepID=A0A813KTR2_POLGL|nr:unnamed protein product [Polarella glacialis]
MPDLFRAPRVPDWHAQTQKTNPGRLQITACSASAADKEATAEMPSGTRRSSRHCGSWICSSRESLQTQLSESAQLGMASADSKLCLPELDQAHLTLHEPGCVASFSAYSQGGLRAFRSTSMGLGLTAVGLSVICALIGWFQARTCRTLGRRCGLAASALEPGGPTPPASQLMTMMPSLSAIETGLRARQRTAWLGSLFAIVGLQSMVGLMVAKVLATSGGLASSPGINLDIFTLLAVGNAALSHVIGGGAAAIQQAISFHHGCLHGCMRLYCSGSAEH